MNIRSIVEANTVPVVQVAHLGECVNITAF